MNSYKDKCDKCGKFDYLKGINGKCLCLNCKNIFNKQNNKKNTKKE